MWWKKIDGEISDQIISSNNKIVQNCKDVSDISLERRMTKCLVMLWSSLQIFADLILQALNVYDLVMILSELSEFLETVAEANVTSCALLAM